MQGLSSWESNVHGGMFKLQARTMVFVFKRWLCCNHHWYHNFGIGILSMQIIGVLRGCIASKCWHLKRWLTLKISSILSLCSALSCRSTNPHEQTAIRPLVNSAPPWLCYYPSFEPWDAFPPPWFCQCLSLSSEKLLTP